MFNKDYKEAMDSITVDRETYDKVLDKIILKEELKDRKNPAIPWRVAFACVACVAIVLGVLFVPRDSFKPVHTNNTPSIQTLKLSKSYDEIYKLIKPKNDFDFWNVFTNKFDDAEIVYEEEIEYAADAMGSNNGVSTDTSARPGATASQNMNSQHDGDSPENLKGENGSNNAEGDDYSNTTEQVEGVAEADIVKTDGKYIYYIKGTTLSIYSAKGAESSLVSRTELSREYTTEYGDMFLKEDRLIIMQPEHYNKDKSSVAILIYDISDPVAPKQIAQVCQDGFYNSARMVGDYMYLISNCHINVSSIDKDDPATFVPTTEVNGVCEPVPADSIYRYEEEDYTNQYTVIGAFNYKDGALKDTASLLGGTDNIYCSQGNIILADLRHNYDTDKEGSHAVNQTVVSRLEIKDGQIEYKCSGEVDGSLENQFFIDEHNGYFRFVTTATVSIQTRQKFDNSDHEVISYRQETSARLTVLDSELKKVGEITDLAKGERVYSVRFMGDTAYFVTFRQTDPLFSADLSDPKNPKILGELKIPGFSEYMYPYGDGLLLGFGMDADEQTGRTTELKLSMFNIYDPTNVTEQDKIIIDNCQHSPALYNHKAMLVNKSKNLIGFATTGDFSNSNYIVLKYTDKGFITVATLKVENDYKYAMDDIRGLFIKDAFYVISENALQVFDITTFTQISIVK